MALASPAAPAAPALVLLAAGLGTRCGRLEQLDPVGPGGTAVLDYTLADAARAGFGRAVVVVRPGIEGEVEVHLERTGAGGLPWTLARQTAAAGLPGDASVPEGGRERPWGTAHAVLCAGPGVSGPFAVTNADDHYGPGAWRCLAEIAEATGVRRKPAADGAVASGRVVAGLLPCGEEWFGMPWPGDRDDVARRLAKRGPPGTP